MPCSATPSFIIGALVALSASALTHLFALWRESKNAKERRKLDFVGLLGGMRAEVERMQPRKYSEIFPTRLFELRRESAKVRRDLSAKKRAIFDEKITSLCALTDSQVEAVADGGNYTGRNLVWNAIDRIVEVLD
jgi:hypothetical protein